MSTAAKTKPILDLDTLAPDRPTVKIRTPENRRGKHYEIVNIEDLSLSDRAELGRLQRKMQTLEPEVNQVFAGTGSPDEDVIGQFEEVIDQFLELAFRGLSPDIIAHLRLTQKEALLGAFTEASPPEIRTRMEEAVKQTQEKLSPGSKPSTAARQKTGSTSARQS